MNDSGAPIVGPVLFMLLVGFLAGMLIIGQRFEKVESRIYKLEHPQSAVKSKATNEGEGSAETK